MTGTADVAAPTASRPRPSRAAVAWTVAFLAWTAFVWVGRIRNAVADAALDDGGRSGPILLSASFLVLALVVATLLVPVARRRAGAAAASAFLVALGALAGWTTVVWVVRVADIAFAGDHDLPFVVVHSVLGAVSVALAALAFLTCRRSMGTNVTLTERT